MSTSTIEPGTRLAGRYRLEERIRDSGGSCLWKAVDEILARAVAVRTFDPGFPRVAEVVTSARAASRLTDPRVTQVFDADDTGESAYVVSEWVAGETLEQMLAKAPLEPGRAAALLFEAAEAVTAAHEAGLAHLCLSPRDLVWTTGGTVKLLGVATDAVLNDRYADDPGAEDVRGLGRMLYAALTAHWPGDPSHSSLPAAPAASAPASPSAPAAGDASDPGATREDADTAADESPAEPLPPRQVQAGVPYAVDGIVCRCLGLPGGQDAPATPAELVKALRGVPRAPLPLFAGLGHAQPAPPRATPPARPNAHPDTRTDAQSRPPAPRHRPADRHRQPPPRASRRRGTAPGAPSQAPQGAHRAPTIPPDAPGPHPGGHRAPGPPAGRPGNRALLAIAAAALTVIVGLGAWALSGDDGSPRPGGTGAGGQTPGSGSPDPTATKLNVTGVTAAEDPLNGRHDTSIGDGLPTITDGRSEPEWETQTYNDVDFGNLSKGLGVVLDMGRPVSIDSVRVETPEGGGTVQVKVGDAPEHGSMRPIGRRQTAPGTFTVRAGEPVTARYVLVWYTQLPPSKKGKISEVTVLGTGG